MVATPVALVVEDYRPYARALNRWLRAESWTAKYVTSVADACDELRGSFDATIVDLLLPDGSGLDVIAIARERTLPVPTLALTGMIDPCLINRAQALGAEFLCKGDEGDGERNNVGVFLRRVFGGRRRRLAEMPNWEALSPRERRLVEEALSTTRYAVIAERMVISENTVKDLVASILAKAGAKRFEDLIASVRLTILGDI